ncbi:replication initiator protein A [uncultured Methylobacterium sp.]|jgi:plasmid replication initiation protein|uniref:replication initiator protein A n=1 Tax=uncultured Methylobacterium sp. TaxID=157278 RepID=UPI0026342E09|nr:replication initiator protein A [uncultured Methylobacterium sp.]
MSPVRLDLMPIDAFSDLGLHDKNRYLQRLADEFCRKTARPAIVLDRDAMSRLRRFYSRRSLADLKLPASEPSTTLDRALRDLGQAVKLNDRRIDIVGALVAELPAPIPAVPTPRRPASREEAEPQLSFFAPSIYDAPLKDDINLMDIAPFSLSKNRRDGVIRYELKDCIITIDGSASAGLATVFDYDIFLHMVSSLADAVRRYRIDQSKGLRVDLPGRVYRPNTAHILRFCRRNSGGKQYKDIEAALDRLQGTRIKIVNLVNGRRREVVSMPLIQMFKVVSKTTTGNIDVVEIGIPDWVYDGVVHGDTTPQILTLNPEYFLINQGIGRFIYRLARKAAGQGEARYGMSEMLKRSGSPQALAQFAHKVRQFVTQTQVFPFPDYELEIVAGRREDLLLMKARQEDAPLGVRSAELLL